MKKCLLSVGWVALAAAMALPLCAQNAVSVELKSKVDTSVAKVGDVISAVTTTEFKENGKTILPKGSKLTGQIAQITPAANRKSPATVEIAFTQAVTPQHQTVALHGGITSIGVGDGSSTFDGGDSLSLVISPVADGATKLVSAQGGNFKLESGQHVQVVLNPATGESTAAGDQ